MLNFNRVGLLILEQALPRELFQSDLQKLLCNVVQCDSRFMSTSRNDTMHSNDDTSFFFLKGRLLMLPYAQDDSNAFTKRFNTCSVCVGAGGRGFGSSPSYLADLSP